MPTQSIAEKEYLTPFTDVPYMELPSSTDEQQGMYRDVKELQIGYGSQVLRASRQGLWLGAEKFEDAPFSVDMQGNIFASSLDLSNFLEVGEAAADVNANATTISGGKITTGSITASKMNVSTLSAITANLGTITAGSMTAVTLATASSGQRVVLTSTFASYYNSSGTNIVNTFASSSSYMIQAQTSGGSIYLDHGTSGTVAFLRNGSVKAVFDGGAEHFSPYVNNSLDLGVSGANWRNVQHAGVHIYQGSDMPLTYWLQVESGSIDEGNDPGWSISSLGTGRFRITHSLGHTRYAALVSAVRGSGAGAYSAKIEAYTTSRVDVTIFDDGGIARDADFMFALFADPN